jgi:dienelactone hydrolase
VIVSNGIKPLHASLEFQDHSCFAYQIQLFRVIPLQKEETTIMQRSVPVFHFSFFIFHFSIPVILLGVSSSLLAAEPNEQPDTSRGDELIAEYFRAETSQLTDTALSRIKTLDDWNARRKRYRKQLFEMLALDPLPKKTDLKPVITGKVEHPEFTVENLHFQSRPGLYVTGNLYVPKNLKGKAPTILYVCGHGRVKKNGISYGNKVTYQHHGAWFARNGYVCLTIDTLQMGEIEGIHHGTYNHDMWWWNARGYSSAGVEAWNCIRALDYLETRPEVDAEHFGVTGRSGGGAYSWWVSALDERIKVAVPVAGITSLHNHVVDGTVEGHCDCMYHVNTYRWDYPMIAALVAPRPLLISNSDKDRIFPLDGVVDVYTKVRRIYELHGKLDHIGLQITEGPHKDTQELRVHAFHWFNKFLKKDPAYANRNQKLIEMSAVKFFEPEQLKVFDKLPADEKNTTIQETFTATASLTPPPSGTDWELQRDGWMAALKKKSFRGWPKKTADLKLKQVFSAESDKIQFSAYDFSSQRNIRLRLYLAHRAGLKPSELDLVVLNALDQQGWNEFLASMQVGFASQLKAEDLPQPDQEGFEQAAKMFQSFKWGMAYVAPRGFGATVWDHNPRKRVQIRRRFMQLGQTLDGMRVWDVRRAVQALRSVEGFNDVPLWMQGEREMAGITLYASLFESDVKRLDLWHLNPSHRNGPIFLNVLRYLDVPQAVAMAAERSYVRIYQDDTKGWDYPQQVAKTLGWEKKQFQIRNVSKNKR